MLERAFARAKETREGREAIARYGACLERNAKDVSRGCCEGEYAAVWSVVERELRADAPERR